MIKKRSIVQKKLRRLGRLLRPYVKQARKIIKSKTLARRYAALSLIILLATTIGWAYLSASVHSSNSDQLVNAYLSKDYHTFQESIFPGDHSLLIKWPLFWLVNVFGSLSSGLIFLTIIITALTVGLFAIILSRINTRPLYFGTICLALASALMMIPAQPYAGAILPLNMAMIASRNLEYIIYIAALLALVKAPRLKSWQFIAGTAGLSVLFASDKLFLPISLGGALVWLIFYRRVRTRLQAAVRRWLVASGVAVIGAFFVTWLINLTGLTHIQGGSSPYSLVHSFKELVLGVFYGATGIFTNMGANPGYDATQIRQLPAYIFHHIWSLGGLVFLLNLAIAGVAIFAVWQIVSRAFTKKKIFFGDRYTLAALLAASGLVAFLLFVSTSHYFVVDARYLTITMFSLFVALAVRLRPARFKPDVVLLGGGLLIFGMVLALPPAYKAYRLERSAMAETNYRNVLVAQALKHHKVKALVGDYWRVLPIKTSFNSIVPMPLSNCNDFRTVLTSKTWQPDLNKTSFAYLLSTDRGLTDFPNCSLEQVVLSYGPPESSVLIAGSLDQPKELLLFYDHGITLTSLDKTQQQLGHVLLPNDLLTIPGRVCSQPTVMNIVAHEDDDLLFMSPDLLHDVKAEKCVRTVYVTAGDAGLGESYWLGREQGSEAAYSLMLGANNRWSQATAKIADKQHVAIAHPRSSLSTSLIFMHLPDGNLYGQGFRASGYQSLTKLNSGKIDAINSVDQQSVYTNQQVIDALVALMQAYQPSEIHLQSNDSQRYYWFTDHQDHLAVANLAAAAYAKYGHGEARFYMGYPAHQLDQNVFGDDLSDKTKAFLTYAAHDESVCQTWQKCINTATYGSYLSRQYTADN